MEKDMTRKGFLAAAAAAGAAALVPGTAMADSSEPGTAPLAALDVEPVEGPEALAGSGWAEMAAGDPIDVVKSHSGMHVMNAPGYFAFTGWDPETDLTSDMGFGYTNGRFVVNARSMSLFSSAAWANMVIVEEQAKEGSLGASAFGQMVVVDGMFPIGALAGWEERVLATGLPRPARGIANGSLCVQDSPYSLNWAVTKDGALMARNKAAASIPASWVYGNLVYVAGE